MGQNDFFYEIAQTKHPAGTTDREVSMRKLPNHYLKQTQRKRLEPIREISYEEQKENFYKELERMKAYYKPFMSNHLSNLPMETPTLSLHQFLFAIAKKRNALQTAIIGKKHGKRLQFRITGGLQRRMENGKDITGQNLFVRKDGSQSVKKAAG